MNVKIGEMVFLRSKDYFMWAKLYGYSTLSPSPRILLDLNTPCFVLEIFELEQIYKILVGNKIGFVSWWGFVCYDK